MIKSNFIASQVKRTNRNLAIVAVLELAAALFLMSFEGIETIILIIIDIGEDPSFMGIMGSLLLYSWRAVLFVIGLWILLRHALVNGTMLLLRLFKNERHPIYKAVSLYGQFDDVAQNIHYDLMNPETKKHKNTYMTKKWILQLSALNVIVLKIEERAKTFKGDYWLFKAA